MRHVDYFSRNPLPPSIPKSIEKIESKRVVVTELTVNWLFAEQQLDSELSKLISDINDDRLPDDIARTYEIRSGIL